jgi:hypothetical protein
MLDKALIQRLQKKSIEVESLLYLNKGDWEETAYQLIAKNFGFKVNSEPFLQLAKSIPYKTLLKHADKPLQIEAILFGQAGLLQVKSKDEYLRLLRREYDLLSVKYNLRTKQMHGSQWRFLRMRPANFPTIRLAQFCSLLASRKKIFSQIVESESAATIKSIFKVTQSPYWVEHYQFGKKAKRRMSALGAASINLLCINTLAPLLVAYGKRTDNQMFTDRAVELLQAIPPESNKITRIWEQLGYRATTAFDSQALIELYKEFCLRRNCLNCSIGSSLVKPGI